MNDPQPEGHMASYIGRRKFLATLGGAAAAWPLAVRAQQSSDSGPLIGILSPLSAGTATRNIEGFRAGLRELGYFEGRNVTLALRFAEGMPERMPALATELVGLKPDVIVAAPETSLLAVRNVTRPSHHHDLAAGPGRQRCRREHRATGRARHRDLDRRR